MRPLYPPLQGKVCKHSTDCSLRILWRTVQVAVDQVLDQTTLQDLLQTEADMVRWVPTLSVGAARTEIN